MKNNHSFRVGDVIVNSWGWEQTNIDFFQVVGVTKASVKIREIAGDYTPSENAFLAGTTVPKIGEFTSDEVKTKRVGSYHIGGDEIDTIRFPYGTGRKWNGKPQYESHYA